jgi:hypothetical protein
MIDWDKVVHGPIQGAFGEPVTYRPIGGPAITIFGVFIAPSMSADAAGGTEIITFSPSLGVQVSQFSMAPEQGDRLTVIRTGQEFVVREVRPDSLGWANLSLNECP